MTKKVELLSKIVLGEAQFGATSLDCTGLPAADSGENGFRVTGADVIPEKAAMVNGNC